jgi:undecaprenyl-diphosphatase
MRVQVGIFQAIVLGFVQGVSEFLPISSRAHLILVRWLFGWPYPGLSFDVALHLGTLAALLLYFYKDWLRLAASSLLILRGETRDPDARLALHIILATIPAAFAGFFLGGLDELSTTKVIGMALIGVAILMRAAEMWGRRKTELLDMTLSDAMTIGLAQAVALIPGVSRSGVTITAGLFRGLTRKASAQYSFLLSAPIVGGAIGKTLIDVLSEGLPTDDALPLVVGILTSAFFGYMAIAGLLRYLQTRSTFVFINYRMALGILLLAFS